LKVIAHDSGRVVVLVDILEFGWGNGATSLDLLREAQERYNFAVATDLTKRANREDPLRFEHGSFGEIAIALFEVHQQGLIAECSTTENAEAFIEDLVSWGAEAFGLARADKGAKRIYTSNLVVQFGSNASGLLSNFASISGALAGALRDLYKIEIPPELSRITIKPDPERLPPRISGLLPDFVLERRVFAPYEEQKFYSVAPLPTKAHEKLLKLIDTAL
jgi:hypothetical protein